jgi:hypothetical protein
MRNVGVHTTDKNEISVGGDESNLDLSNDPADGEKGEEKLELLKKEQKDDTTQTEAKEVKSRGTNTIKVSKGHQIFNVCHFLIRIIVC